MESLYRKYRPLTFESVVGQTHIVSTLKHAVAEGRLSHAYLFCGPRGTGKTTMARILAKSLLCQGAEAARATGASGCMPDGCCPECEAIAAGTHPDVYELDAASRTGVDNVREEIISSVNFAPVRGAYKVYIIDEVHMLTPAAFNALLKTLEEPPSHVVFVLCTTDPQKILETILSRCQRFDFHRISNEDIVGRLRYICEQEGFAFDEEALEIVAKHARGGMRDALSTLEQLSVFGGGSVRVDDARALLGEVASTVLAEFACKIAVRDTVGLFGLVREQADEGNDLLELTHDLVAHVRDVYTAAIAGPKEELFDGTPEEVAALVEEARLFEGADRLARALTVLDDAALEMRNASDPRLVLDIALTRLARPETDLTLEALAERVARLEAQLAAGVPSGPMGAGKLPPVAAAPRGAAAGGASSSTPSVAALPVLAPAAPEPPVSPAGGEQTIQQAQNGGASSSSVSSGSEAPIPATPDPGTGASAAPVSVAPAAASAPASAAPVPVEPVLNAHASAAPGGVSAQAAAPVSAAAPARAAAQVSTTVPADAEPEMAACAITPPAADAGDLQRRWLDAVKRVTAAQPSRGGLLQSSRAVSDDGETLTISFPKGSDFALKMITRPDSAQLVMPVICQVFGKRSVTYVMEGSSPVQSAGASGGGAAPRPVSPAPAPSTPAPARPAAATNPAAPASVRPSAAPAVQEAVPAAPASVPAPATNPAVPAPAQGGVAPAPAFATPTEAAAPTPASGRAVGERAGTTQATPGSAPAQVDQASGPTVLPEPDVDTDRKAWLDEQVPYDDATIATYADDEEIPPFDMPAPSVPAGRPVSDGTPGPASADRASNGIPSASAASGFVAASGSAPGPETRSVPTPAPVAPATPDVPANSGAASPTGAPVATPGPTPAPTTSPAPTVSPAAPPSLEAEGAQVEPDPKTVLESIWGNVVYK